MHFEQNRGVNRGPASVRSNESTSSGLGAFRLMNESQILMP